MERISPRFLNTFPPDKMLCHPYWIAEPPFRIWGNLYFVGNSWCSSHLIDTGDGLILLDPPVWPSCPICWTASGLSGLIPARFG